MFGMSEIVDGAEFRKMSAVCTSESANVFYMAREHFIDAVNNFKFSGEVL
jgi:hypothetical protein